MGQEQDVGRFVEAFGLAVLELWSRLPQDIQHDLFEQAVRCGHKTERDESLREQMAQFLHAHNARTVEPHAGQADPV